MKKGSGQQESSEKKKPVWVQVLARCPECGGDNKIVVDWNNLKHYHKCQACEQSFPTELYWAMLFTNDFSHPLWFPPPKPKLVPP